MSAESVDPRKLWKQLYTPQNDFLRELAQHINELGFNMPIKKYLLKVFKGFKGKILDVGSGKYNDTYLSRTRRPVCVDWVHNAFLFNKGRNIVADARNLPFGDGTFEAVVSKQVYSYMSNPNFLLEEMVRVLKPGGLFILIDIEGEFSAFESHRKKGKVADFIPGNIVPTLSTLGLQELKTDRIDGLKVKGFPVETGVPMDTFITAIVGRKM